MYHSTMLKTIVPAQLEFKDGVPYSAAYGDIYHSADGGEGQARHVFLQGCGLPQAWANRAHYVILETGFGTGLNFLTTWAAWRADPSRPQRLHFLSVEKHPFRLEELKSIHAMWPELHELSAELQASWPVLTPGFHRIALDQGRVQLTLMLGNAVECLPQLQARVDAFYLDGFFPDCNADLWQPALYADYARLARPGAVAATYTVTASVRQGLAAAGFVCEKRAGYGRKRHCLSARFSGEAREPTFAAPRHVAIIGAGVAGSATAHALAQRGIRVTVLERAESVAQGASGNPMAVFRPLISRDDNRLSRLTRAAFLHDVRAWAALGHSVEWSRSGVLHLPKNEDLAAKMQRALMEIAPPNEFARWVDLDEARDLANWPVATPGVFFPTAGWMVPGSLCRAWLAHSSIELKTGCEVRQIQAVSSGARSDSSVGWRLLDGGGAVLVEADAVVLATAHDVVNLLPKQPWPITAVRGQVSRLPAGCLPEIHRIIAREGYVAPGGGQPVVGATYEHDDEDTLPRRASDEANMARLEAILPGASQRVDREQVSGRASLRATLPDRMPMAGAVTGQAGLYVATGYASRGVVWAGLLGELLGDLMTGQPLPLEAELVRAISPARYDR